MARKNCGLKRKEAHNIPPNSSALTFRGKQQIARDVIKNIYINRAKLQSKGGRLQSSIPARTVPSIRSWLKLQASLFSMYAVLNKMQRAAAREGKSPWMALVLCHQDFLRRYRC